MTNTDWRIPPSTLRWLDEVSFDVSVAVLLRHSVRGPLPPGDVGNTVPITDVGAELGRQLGGLIGHRLCSLHTSPVLRCGQTARAIGEGADVDIPIVPDRMLGEPGAYVTNGESAWSNWNRLGHHGVMQHLISNDEPLLGMAPPDTAARSLVHHMIQTTKNRPGIHVFVTHDLHVIVTVARLLGKQLEKDAWPWFLEGAFFWREGEQVSLAYREDWAGGVLSSLCSFE